jgi:SAM-dependent methyltransferase
MTNVETVIRQAFERPEWYLTKTAYNITVRAETIVEFIGTMNPKNILDIGCGDGSLSLPLLTADTRISLLDRSKTMLSIASARVPDELSQCLSIFNDDFMNVDLATHSYDLILCVGVMAYVDDRRPFIEKIASLLKPGGALIVECTDGDHWISRLSRAYKRMRTSLGGVEVPTLRRGSAKLLTMLSESGFRLNGAFRYSLPPPGFRRLLSQRASYQAIRLIYGRSTNNRFQSLGNECIYRLQIG